jgi:3-hydroxyacyl-[acyl-carrier-protein] dehydratase
VTDAVEAATETLGSVDIRRLLELLPHRYPFLLVDRIIGIKGDERGIGIKNVTMNEPQFTGHFPGSPIMPGVLIIEGMAQTAGAMCVAAGGSTRPQLVYFMTIDKAKFRKPVVPGDRLEYHMTKLKSRSKMWWFRGEAKVDGVVVAEAELSAMISDQ